MEKSYLEGVLRLLDCLEKDCGSGRRNMDNLKGNVAKGRSKSISRELGLAEEHGSQMQTIQKIYSQLRYHI